MIADVDGQPDLVPLFDAESVRLSIPESIRPERLGLWSARPVIEGESRWIISAMSLEEADKRDFLIVLDRRDGQAKVAFDFGHFHLFQPPMVSPGGNYAVASGVSADGNEVNIEIVNTATGEIRRLQPFIPTDWSADDAWLLAVDSGTLHLTSTSAAQEWTVVHDLRGCYYAVWTVR
jgi:hypothetical protein